MSRTLIHENVVFKNTKMLCVKHKNVVCNTKMLCVKHKNVVCNTKMLCKTQKGCATQKCCVKHKKLCNTKMLCVQCVGVCAIKQATPLNKIPIIGLVSKNNLVGL